MIRMVTMALAVVLAAGMAAAQEVKHTEPVVVTATKVETPAEQLGASVTVIPGEDIDARRYPTVDEALRGAPGVDIRRSGSFGKTSAISIRGANPSQVQVLVDGMRVKSPTLGQVDLSDLSPELIERIEIIRGPQSTLYGADAIGGVVNIITRKGKGPFSLWATQEVGNYEILRSATGFSGSVGIFDYAFATGHFESNGQTINDGTNQNSLNGRFGLSLPGNTTVSLAVRWNKTDTGVPIEFVASPQPIVPTIDPNTHQETETVIINLAAHTRPVPWWESEMRVGRYWNRQVFIDPPDPFTCPPITFGPPCDFSGLFKVERREIEWLNHFHVGNWSTSTFGLEYRWESADVQGTNGFGPTMETVSGLFQQQFRFFDRLFMAAGVRVEDNDVFGRSVTERGSLSFLIKETGTRIHGGAGSGFRVPTFNDLFFPGFSNPALKPEESFSFDAGIGQKLWNNRIRLDATFFKNSFTNLIKNVIIPAPPFVVSANVGRARSQGLEFTSEVDVLETLTAAVNYTYTETRDLDAHTWLPREPRHRWNARVTWQPVKPLSLWSELHIVTRQWESLGNIYNPGYTRLDIGGTYRILERWGLVKSVDLTARIQNVANESYQEVRGFPALGITGIGGVRVAFE